MDVRKRKSTFTEISYTKLLTFPSTLLMSGDGKGSAGHRPQATAPILDFTSSPIPRGNRRPQMKGRSTCTLSGCGRRTSNLTRVMNIVGIKPLIVAIGT